MLCIALLGGQLLASLPVERFTLAWTHSVERIEWQEDWRVTDGRLTVEESRVRGSGAGMEIPDGAVLADGWWRYRPDLPALERVVLANSTFTADYRICAQGRCRALASVTGVEDEPVALSACPRKGF